MPEWEQKAAIATYEQAKVFILAGVHEGQFISHLTQEQGGRLICIIWTDQMRTHFGNTKPSYVSPWKELPDWQQKVDMDIFETIQATVLQEIGREGTIFTELAQ